MTQLTSKAGGIFIFLGVVAGIAWGIAAGDIMKGVILGTASGIAAAALVWLVDRRRRS